MMQRRVQDFVPPEFFRVDGSLLHTRGHRAATVARSDDCSYSWWGFM